MSSISAGSGAKNGQPNQNSKMKLHSVELSDQVDILLFAPSGPTAEKISKLMLESGSFTILRPGKARFYDNKKETIVMYDEERIHTKISIQQLLHLIKNARNNHPYQEMGFDTLPTLSITSSLWTRLWRFPINYFIFKKIK